jgi:uncharacterized membrane protein (UPF0127 family)
MKAAALFICALSLLFAMHPAARVSAPMPRSHVAHEVDVLWHGDGSVTRLLEPGTHELTVPCAHVRGEQATLEVDIERVPLQAPDRTGDEVMALCLSRTSDPVRFEDKVTSFEPLLGGGQDVLALPGGAEVGVMPVFRTEGGFVCLVPVDRPAAGELCRGGGIGMTWSLTGRPLKLADGAPAFMVMHAAYPGSDDLAAVSWKVSLSWAGQPAGELTSAGRHSVTLPCQSRPGAREQVTILIREYHVVDLDVGGHTVKAELAATPNSRSWGLQGRRSLGDDEGMIFYFGERLRPTFVMKTVSFPLSIAFITADGTIVNIEQMDPGYRGGVSASRPVSYVLEMRKGWFAERGIEPGALVAIP